MHLVSLVKQQTLTQMDSCSSGFVFLQEVDVPRLWSELVKAGTAVSDAASGMEVESEGQSIGKIMWQKLVTCAMYAVMLFIWEADRHHTCQTLVLVNQL